MSLGDDETAARIAGATGFRRLVHTATCTSTQDLAANDPGEDDAVFWADHQTAGRGRQQRPWHDEPGADLAVTFRARPQLPAPVTLPVVAPLCAIAAVAPLLGEQAGSLRLKWPNDVLLDGRKLAGVLIDADQARPGRFLIGIGLNVNGRLLPAGLRDTATSLLLATGREHDRALLLVALATELHGALAALAAGAVASYEERFRRHLGLMHRDVVVHTGEVARGRLAALTMDGLRLGDGRTFPLGQVRELRAE